MPDEQQWKKENTANSTHSENATKTQKTQKTQKTRKTQKTQKEEEQKVFSRPNPHGQYLLDCLDDRKVFCASMANYKRAMFDIHKYWVEAERPNLYFNPKYAQDRQDLLRILGSAITFCPPSQIPQIVKKFKQCLSAMFLERLYWQVINDILPRLCFALLRRCITDIQCSNNHLWQFPPKQAEEVHEVLQAVCSILGETNTLTAESKLEEWDNTRSNGFCHVNSAIQQTTLPTITNSDVCVLETLENLLCYVEDGSEIFTNPDQVGKCVLISNCSCFKGDVPFNFV